MARSRPLPPHLPPLAEQVRLRELSVPSADYSQVTRPRTAATPATTSAVPTPPQISPRPLHPLLEQTGDLEAMASVLLSALEQEQGQNSRHHARIAKHILSLAQGLRRDLTVLLEDPPSDADVPQP